MTAVSGLPQDESHSERAPSRSRSLSASVRRGALWVAAANMLFRLANVLVAAVVARILSPRDFGIFAVALTAHVLASNIGQLGIASCLMRADLDIDGLGPTALAVSVLSNAILAGLMVTFATPIAGALGSTAAASAIRVMSLAVFLVGVLAVPQAQCVRDFRQDKVFLANVAGFVPSTVLLFVMAKAGSGATAFAYSRVAYQLGMGCVLMAAVPRHYRPRLARSALSVIIRFGIPLAAANFVSFILLNVDYMFIGHLLGATELGVYVLAFTATSSLYSLLGAVINSVSLPAFTRIKHDTAVLRNSIVAALRGVSLIVMPMCALTMALARPAVLTLYGAKWAASTNPLAILSIYGVISTGCLLIACVVVSLGRPRLLFALQLIWIGALVPAMILGVRHDGITGAAYAHVAVVVPVILPSYLLALKRVTGVRLMALAKAVLPALLASSVAFAAARSAASAFQRPLEQLVAGVTAGGLIYLMCAGEKVMALFGLQRSAPRLARILATPTRLPTRAITSLLGHSGMAGEEYTVRPCAETPQGAVVVDPEPGCRASRAENPLRMLERDPPQPDDI